MKPSLFAAVALACIVLPSYADVVILNDGSSYSGQLDTGKKEIAFTGTNGVGYHFPVRDVQSVVFTGKVDTITLRNGRTYSGQYNGASPLAFTGSEGISYQFPVKDISSLVLTGSGAAAAAEPTAAAREEARKEHARVIPEGSEITIRTGEGVDSKRAQSGELFPATVVNEVRDSAGGVAIPSGTPAKLVISNSKGHGAVSSSELVLDLYSVTVGGRRYRAITSNVVEKGKQGLGANKRTLEYTGGGTGLGALLGGIFGGGQGAGIGALAGAGGGALTQLFTRGQEVKVPAETTLTFRLERTLVLRP
ncbi:MAG: hypothetical protein ACR2JE_00625 [Acidobacteriaceae bacterium]